MNLSLSKLAFGLALGLAALNATAKSKSMLLNGNFEAVSDRGASTNWMNKQHAGKRAYEFRADTDHKHGGERSLRITRLSEEYWGGIEQYVPVTPDMIGKTVELKVWVRRSEVGKKGYRVRLGSWLNSMLLEVIKSEPFAGDSDWVEHVQQLKIPENTTQLSVMVTLEDGGTIWVDDASLRVVKSR